MHQVPSLCCSSSPLHPLGRSMPSPLLLQPSCYGNSNASIIGLRPGHLFIQANASFFKMPSNCTPAASMQKDPVLLPRCRTWKASLHDQQEHYNKDGKRTKREEDDIADSIHQEQQRSMLGIPLLLLSPPPITVDNSSLDESGIVSDEAVMGDGDDDAIFFDQIYRPVWRGQRCLRFYNMIDGMTHSLDYGHFADIAADYRYVVSSSMDGWLMYMDRFCELHCVNLTTGERISIPSITTLPDITGVEMDSYGRVKGYHFQISGEPSNFRKGLKVNAYKRCNRMRRWEHGIILFPHTVVDDSSCGTDNADSISGNENEKNKHKFMVVASFSDTTVFARDGDTSWTVIDRPDEADWNSPVLSMKVHKGFLYLAFFGGYVIARLRLAADLSCVGATTTTYDYEGDCADWTYLAEIDGHLYRIQRNYRSTKDGQYPVDRSNVFEVHRLEDTAVWEPAAPQNDGDIVWIPVHSIGNFAVFVGNNQSMAFSTHDFPQLIPDCIYFTDTLLDSHQKGDPWDIGVFHLKDRKVRPFPHVANNVITSLDLPQPAWVMPFTF